MKAIVIQHDGKGAKESHLKVLMEEITRVIVALLGATKTDVQFFDDADIAAMLMKESSKKNRKSSTPTELESACEYVFHLYGGDVLRVPCEQIEKDMVYHLLSIDDIHSSNLRQACEIICKDKPNARVWFTNNHAGSLLDNVSKVMQMIGVRR